jgi:CRP-like cAMP-binding protein
MKTRVLLIPISWINAQGSASAQYRSGFFKTSTAIALKDAEERVAAFLVNLAGRLHARGFSRTELNLPMTREAIGSYLGMKIETVSRIFTRLVEQGMVKVNRRHVHILDPVALIRRVGQFEAVPAMALLSWS